MLGPARILQRALDPGDSELLPAVEYVDETTERAGGDLGLPRVVLRTCGPQRRHVLPKAILIAHVERQHRGKHERGRSAEWVTNVVGQRQGRGTRTQR